MSEHSKLPPSSAARRVMCPGSRKMEELYPREETDSAREGTLAHEVCARALRGEEDIESISKEMLSHCDLYINYVINAHASVNFNLSKYAKNSILHIEETLSIHPVHLECWGTPDAWFITDGVLNMFDFKYGFSPVDVFENWQMVEYSAGVPDHFDKAVFHIVQPRAFHPDGPIRTWEVGRPRLEAMWERLKRVEWLSMDENAYIAPSDQCVNCKARHACPALQSTTLNHLDNLNLSTPADLNNEELGNELRILQHASKMLDARITGLEEEVLAKLKAGNRIPHYELGEVQSRERWAKDEKDILGLSELYGVDLKKPMDFITPKQAIAAGIPAQVVRKFSETPKGAVKLVAIDEKKIRKIFEK